jgi:hypothetical protein
VATNVTGRALTVSNEIYRGVAAALYEALHSALTAGSDKLGTVEITRSDSARGMWVPTRPEMIPRQWGATIRSTGAPPGSAARTYFSRSGRARIDLHDQVRN